MKRHSVGITLLVVLLACGGCASLYRVAPDDLADQLKAERNSESGKEALSGASPVLPNIFNASDIKRIKCINESGDSIWVYTNTDTQLQITTRAGEEVAMYFDTIVLDGTKLKGVTSRVQKTVRQVDLSDVLKIKVYVVNSKTEPVHPG